MRTWIDRSSVLDAPLDEVAAVLLDLDRWPEWTPGLRGIPGTRILHRFELTDLPGGRTQLRHVEDATGLLALLLRPLERVFAAHDHRWSDAIEARFAATPARS